MELGLNLPRPDDCPPVAGAEMRPPAEPPAMDAESSAAIAIGHLILQVGERGGATLREARRAERAHFRPRPSPIVLRPRLLRGLVDRRTETVAALSAIDAGLPVEVSGPSGIGKTAFLRHLAHHPRAGSFVDGIVYLSAKHRTSLDLRQRIFEAFYESDTICRPTDAEIRRALQDKHALVLLDDVALPQDEVEAVLDIAPHFAFVVASRERCLWGEVRSIALAGLGADAAAVLLERALERPLDAAEQSAVAELCGAIEGYPSRILQAAAIIRKHDVPAGDWPKHMQPDGPVAVLMTSIDDKERRVLLTLSALFPVSIDGRHVSGLAELPDAESTIRGLVDRGLVLIDQSRYRLADGVRDRLRRTADLMPPVHRAITYFNAWAERQRRNGGTLLEASDALLRVQQHATDTRRWGEALALGRLLEAPLVVSARWGDWERVLEHCLSAARALGDRPVEAGLLHQMGTRAVCLGDEGNARRLLSQSAAMRDALGEHAAAAISRRNLAFLPAVVDLDVRENLTPLAVAGDAGDRLTPAAADSLELDALPLRSEAVLRHRPRTSGGAGEAILMLLTCAMLGLFAFLATSRALSSGIWTPFGSAAPQPAVPQARNADAAITPPPLRDMTEVVPSGAQGTMSQRANIRIFTARPGSIATTGRSNLCYAVTDAVQTRIEPAVGDVEPASTLTCHRVAPVRTTTYELSATGRDGMPVTQQIVIVVR